MLPFNFVFLIISVLYDNYKYTFGIKIPKSIDKKLEWMYILVRRIRILCGRRDLCDKR